MAEHDIAVVGASAAGLLAAERLQAGGRRVAVMERTPDLRPVPRTLIVTRAFLDIAGPGSENAVVSTVGRFELFADGKVADVELADPDLIIERRQVIEHLAQRAEDSGVDFEFGARVAGVGEIDGGVSLSGRRGRDAWSAGPYRAVIGADGACSRVARAGGWTPTPTVPLLQAIVERPVDLGPDTARVWFRPQDTPYFFWLIPDGEDRSALGVIGCDPSNVRDILDRFLEEHDLKATSYQAAVIPAYSSWTDVRRRVGAGDVYLVGDAAGHVKVSTVGGIVTGLRGAVAVAMEILHGKDHGLRSLKRELSTHLLIRKALNAFTEDDYRYLIGGLRPSEKQALRRTHRDDATRALLSFVRSKPGVVVRALRALLARG